MQDDLMKSIATNLGIADLSLEAQQKIVAQFGEVALKAATVAMLEKLTEEKRDEFTALATAGDAAALQTFLDREVPDHDAIAKATIAKEVYRFKESQTS